MPALHYWFTGSAFFTIGSFALFAILGFAGIERMSATYRRMMFFGYAVACGLFLLGWWQAAQQEQASAGRDTEFSIVESAIKKIAGSADVSLNQSADQIAAAVIAKLQPLQKQVDTLSQRAPDELYQGGIPLGRVAGMMLNDAKTAASFKVVTADRQIDFGQEIELQGARLSCSSIHGPSAIMSFGANQAFTYTDMTCKVIGPRQ
jgi:hypothetical protein